MSLPGRPKGSTRNAEHEETPVNPSARDSIVSILVVDDHPLVREGLKRLLDDVDGWRVTVARSAFEALDLLRRQAFDLAVVDLSMPEMSGLDLVRRVRHDVPRLRILMLSMHSEAHYALRAFKAGANGYITKDSATRDLASAVRKVVGGGVYVSPSLAEHVVLHMNGSQAPERHAQLSNRELDVLRRLVAGHRPTEIASAMNLSIKTVSTHKRRILDRLQLPSLAALVRYSVEHGLGTPDGTIEGDTTGA